MLNWNALLAGCGACIFLKSEFFNPLASVKDRIGAAMIEAAERDGLLKPDSVVIDPHQETQELLLLLSVQLRVINASLRCRKPCLRKDGFSQTLGC